MHTEVKVPMLDERVEEILLGLADGKTREELATEFGNSSWKSVDMYMRRKGYSWDAHKQTYVLKDETESIPQMTDTTKAGKVIFYLKAENAEPKKVAVQLGFKDHRDMAQYMMSKGYEWQPEENNYRKKVGIIEEQKPTSAEVAQSNSVPPLPPSFMVSMDLQKYLPLLQLLDERKEQLLLLLQPSETKTIPRYLLPGIARTKTIQMMNTLQDLVVDYCRENNINQRVLFEVALIEFFQKYGYEQEVEMLLKS